MGSQFSKAAPAASTATGSSAASKVSHGIDAKLRHVMASGRMARQQQFATRVAVGKVDHVETGCMCGSSSQIPAGRMTCACHGACDNTPDHEQQISPSTPVQSCRLMLRRLVMAARTARHPSLKLWHACEQQTAISGTSGVTAEAEVHAAAATARVCQERRCLRCYNVAKSDICEAIYR